MNVERSNGRVAALLRWASSTRPVSASRVGTAGVTAARILAGFIFFSSGMAKEVLPATHDKWEGMVHQLGVPLEPFVVQAGAALEIVVGALLLLGLLSRLAAIGGLALMAGAAWIHITEPASGLPPIWYPILTALACAVVLWQGAGAWSLDRRRAARVHAALAAQ